MVRLAASMRTSSNPSPFSSTGRNASGYCEGHARCGTSCRLRASFSAHSSGCFLPQLMQMRLLQVNSIVLTSPHLGHLHVRKPYPGLGIAASSRLQRRSPPPGKVLIPVRLPILIALEDVFDRGPRKPLVLSHDYRATRPHNFLSERQEYVWLLHLGVTIKPTGLEHSIHRSEHSRFGV